MHEAWSFSISTLASTNYVSRAIYNIKIDLNYRNNEEEKLAKGDNKNKLLRIEEMPDYLQFNPYIITGYRELLTTEGSLRSLFYFHNETVNILTHGKYRPRLL